MFTKIKPMIDRVSPIVEPICAKTIKSTADKVSEI